MDKVLAKNVISQRMRHEFDKGAIMSNELDVVVGKQRAQAKAERARH